jgi:hypothetical protein
MRGHVEKFIARKPKRNRYAVKGLATNWGETAPPGC